VVAGDEPLASDATLSKLDMFPLLAQDNGYIDTGAASGYVNVDDTYVDNDLFVDLQDVKLFVCLFAFVLFRMGDVPQAAGYISMNDTF